MFNPMGASNPQDLGNGGEIDGNLSITGDLTVSGGIGLTLSEVIQGTSTIDVTNTEALLVRKDGDAGDVFIVDTTNNDVTVGSSSLADGTLIIESNSSGDPKLQFTSTANRIGIMDFVEAGTLQGSIVYDHNGDNLKFATGSTNRTARLTVNETTSTFTSSLNVSGGILTLGTANISSGHINAFENMSFNIDINNARTDRFFEFSINGSSGSGTELMRLTETGQLGIGTSSPEERIHSTGAIVSTGVNDTGATAGTERAFIDLVSNKARIGHFRGTTSAGSGGLQFYTDSVERARIDASGSNGV